MEWVRFKFLDWLADTRGLSIAEEGTYLRLLTRCYMTERPLALDAATLCHDLGVKRAREQATVARVLARFFQETPGGWTHKRVQKELTYVERRSNAKQRNVTECNVSAPLGGGLSNDNNGNSANDADRLREDKNRKKEAAPDPTGSPMANLFSQYTTWLSEGEQIDIKRARTMLAKWRNEVGDVELGALLLRAQDKGVSGPIAWITAAIQQTHKRKEIRIQ